MMRTLSELRVAYDGELRPALENFEERRRKTLKTYLKLLAVVSVPGIAVILFGIIYVLPNIGNFEAGWFLGILFMLFVVNAGVGLILMGEVFIVNRIALRGYRAAYKQDIGNLLVHCIDPSFIYLPNEYISSKLFDTSCLFKGYYNRYSGEDKIAGLLCNTLIELSYVTALHIYQKRDSDGKVHTVTDGVHNGLFFNADFNKSFHGTTVVLPRGVEPKAGLEDVELEDPEFTKLFSVYTDDQIGARYVLSLSLMRRLVEFVTNTDQAIYVSFVDSLIYVAMPMERSEIAIRPRLFRTAVNFDLIMLQYTPLAICAGLVEELNLNTRIWTKE